MISGAAGSVGSLVGQIAKILGCRAIGIAGTDDKCAWVTDDLGFDACVNYKTENVRARLEELCPDGIDVYFDNVGGEILDAALTLLALNARVAVCGTISTYNSTGKPDPIYWYPNLVASAPAWRASSSSTTSTATTKLPARCSAGSPRAGSKRVSRSSLGWTPRRVR